MPAVQIGEVFHDPNFRFPDGESGNKLLIVLAVSRCGDFIVARTTSKPRAHSWTYGCHNDSVEPNFFIPKTLNIFHEDTWVCLDYLVELDSAEFSAKVSGAINKIAEIPVELLKLIIDCASRADDTTQRQEQDLRNTLVNL